LISVTKPNLAVIYVVDGLNRRVAKKVGSTAANAVITKQWLYKDGLKPIAELDGSGNLLSTFVYASNPNVPDYMVRAGQTYRILTDQVGSVRMVVNVASGLPAFSASYTSFGVATPTGTPDFLPFGFAAGVSDIDTGLVRFGARDYDPMVGRWVTKDPIGFGGGQANLYEYAGSDPVNYSDPAGMCTWAASLNYAGASLAVAAACGAAGEAGGLNPLADLACAGAAAAYGAAAVGLDHACHPPPPPPPPPSCP
jgi:RHS repeat-associated protein